MQSSFSTAVLSLKYRIEKLKEAIYFALFKEELPPMFVEQCKKNIREALDTTDLSKEDSYTCHIVAWKKNSYTSSISSLEIHTWFLSNYYEAKYLSLPAYTVLDDCKLTMSEVGDIRYKALTNLVKDLEAGNIGHEFFLRRRNRYFDKHEPLLGRIISSVFPYVFIMNVIHTLVFAYRGNTFLFLYFLTITFILCLVFADDLEKFLEKVK